MTEAFGTHAKNSKTGKHHNAKKADNAKPPEHALFNFLIDRNMNRPQRRLAPEDIHARLILIIGGTLAATFFVLVVGAVWALVFVTQPMKQAPNDAAFIDLLKTLAIFLTGSLGGVLAGNGLKSKAKDKDTPAP